MFRAGDGVLPSLHILPATVTDLPAIAELAAESWRAHYPGIISGAQIEYMLERMYSLETLTREITTEGISYDRLLVDGRLIGFAAYGPAGERIQKTKTCKLHKLYLHPAFQRRGYGSALLEHVCSTAAAHGYATLILAVNKMNVKAIAAYQKNGFAVR